MQFEVSDALKTILTPAKRSVRTTRIDTNRVAPDRLTADSGTNPMELVGLAFDVDDEWPVSVTEPDDDGLDISIVGDDFAVFDSSGHHHEVTSYGGRGIHRLVAVLDRQRT